MKQRTPEWFEMRRKYIGASDAPPIMGVSPWKTALDIFHDKTSIISRESSICSSMQRGIDLEPKALELFENLTGYLCIPKVVFHPTISYMMASLDGISFDGKEIVEIKCPGKTDHESALDGQIPEKYIPQLHHQMITTGLKKAYYFSYTVTSHKLLEIYLDEEYAKDLLKKESDFWHCVTTKTEPKLENKYIHMTSKEWNDAATEWRELQSKKRELDLQEKACKDRLLRIANDQNAEGNGVKVSKYTRKGTIDMDLAKKNEKIDFEKYRKPEIEAWRIT